MNSHLRSMHYNDNGHLCLKLMEPVKSILDINPRLFKSETLGNSAFNERNDVVAKEAKDYPRERRPAPGCKRARFSLKPNKIQPTEILIPTLDIDYLKDPEEFFMAYERLENAKREIQKQVGGISFEPNQNNKSTDEWRRRPRLPGNNQRRSVRYKHRYSVKTINNDHVPSFQEIFKPSSQGLVGERTDKTGAYLASLGSELAEPLVMEENKINDILDELLHSSCEDQEEDESIALLQESLWMRPIILEKLSIPDSPDNQVANLTSFGRNFSKPGKALSNPDNLLKEMHNKTPVKLRWDVGNFVRQLVKRPFAPLSSLLKRRSLSKSSVDPSPMLYSDNLSTRNTSLVNQEVNLVNSGNPAPLIEDDVAVRNTNLVEDSVTKCDSSSGNFKEDNSGKPSSKMNAFLIKDSVAVSKASSIEDTSGHCARTYGKSKEDNSKELGFDFNISTNESHVDIDVDIGHSEMGDRIMDDTVSRPNSEDAVASVPGDDPDLNLVNPQDESTIPGVQANAMDECTRTFDVGDAEKCLQEKTKASKVSVIEQRQGKLHSRRERKNKRVSRRQSLAAAGTSWKSGVRRSTRIKTRPLEYWKGERLVYGRVHESLATVIGVKYMSAGSAGGKPTMKVKSYVSDEHKELLAQASQY